MLTIVYGMGLLPVTPLVTFLAESDSGSTCELLRFSLRALGPWGGAWWQPCLLALESPIS